MKKGFNLSNEIVDDLRGGGQLGLRIEDVKEFIKREDNLLVKLRMGDITPVEFWDLRDKLAGDKLK